MKTKELIGATLDYWVARAEGKDAQIRDGVCRLRETRALYQPSQRWAVGGPIIDRKEIGVNPHRQGWGGWITLDCYESNSPDAEGPTALVAAMRAYLVTVYGQEVPHGVS